MLKEAIATGSTIDEAREEALRQLGAGEDEDIQFEVIDRPQKKVLGLFGGCPAKVRAYTIVEDKPAKPAKPAAERRAKSADQPRQVKKQTEEKLCHDKKTPPMPGKSDEKPAHAHKPRPERKPETPETTEKPERRPITDENKQKVADMAVEYLTEVLNKMDVKATISAAELGEAIELTLDGDNLGIVVGRRGETLDALQYLTVLAANRVDGSYHRIILDTGNYRERRCESLRSLAHKMASQCLRTGRNSTLEPMNPYERRIIHTAVQDIEGVTSWSVGSEPMRRVVIGRPRTEGSGRSNYRQSSDRGRRDNNSRRPKPEQSAQAAQPERESKTDVDTAPLYGRIG